MSMSTPFRTALAVPMFLLLTASFPSQSQPRGSHGLVESKDIPNFWRAYDRIAKAGTRDEKAGILERDFIAPGSPGLHGMMERRGYTIDAYLDAIEHYPKFWNSIRANTLTAEQHARAIEQAIGDLRTLYPDLKPAKVYFTIGALMSGGTTLGDRVLIGSEIAMADHTTVTSELPGSLGENLRRHFDTDPIRDVVLLNLHEYVHTQQGPFGADLLTVSLQEGVAEYVSTLAMRQPSAAPAVAFGQTHADEVRNRFATEMFSPNYDDWLYNDTENTFATRDLGYYVGYAMSKAYHERAKDKRAAIKHLIELDYRSPAAVAAVVEESGYFNRPLSELRAAYDRQVPRVIAVTGLHNGDTAVDPAVNRITIRFSAPLNPRFRSFEYGPLGENHVLGIERIVGYSEDRTEMTLEVKLKPGMRQQVQFGSGFRTDAGPALEPYLIDITTR